MTRLVSPNELYHQLSPEHSTEFPQNANEFTLKMTQGAQSQLTVLFGFVKVFGTFLSLWWIDVYGRRAILLLGVCCMAIGWIVASASYSTEQQTATFLGLGWIVLAYALGFGCASWVIVAELFPDAFRSKAIGFASVVNWITNLLVLSSYVSITDWFGQRVAFFLFTAVCIAALIFM